MRKTFTYNFLIFLLVFAIALIVPIVLLIDQTTKSVITDMEKIAPLSAEQKIIYNRLLHSSKDKLVSMSFYIFVIAFVISLFFGKRLLGPIKELYAGAMSIKEGNFDVNIKVSGEHELKDVVVAFNEMAGALKKKTEELLWKDRYVNMMMDPLWVVDNENVVIDANPAFSKLLGYERDEIIGYPVFEFMDEENEKVVRKQLQFRDKGMTSAYELTLISKQGDSIPVLISGAPIYNENDEIIGKIGIMKDFRKELALRNALNEESDYRRAIMDSLPDTLVVVDRNFNIIMANKSAMESVTGDILSMHCYEAFYSRPMDCTSEGRECPVLNVFNTGKPSRVVHEIFDQQKALYREVIAYPIKDEAGVVKSAVAALRDITETKRFEDEIAQRNKELTTLLGISKTLNQSLRAEEIFNSVLEKLIELTGMDGGGIFFLDDFGKELACKYYKGLSSDFIKTSGSLRIGEDIPGRVAATGQIFTTSDLPKDHRAEKSIFQHTGIRACATFPIKGKEKTIGVFTIFSFSPHVFSYEEERILSSAGEMTGMAFENVRLYERMRILYQHQKWRRSEEQKQLVEISSVLATHLDTRDMLNKALSIIKHGVRADFVWFLEKDTEGNLVLLAPGDEIPEGTIIYEKGTRCIENHAMEKKEPIVVTELQVETDFKVSEFLSRKNFNTACSIPVYSGDKAFAALSFYSTTFKQPKEEDLFFLNTIASMLDVAIERTKLYEKFIMGKGMSDTILESIEDGIITVDPHGMIIAMNRTAEELSGISIGEALGRACTGLFNATEENQKLNLLFIEGLDESLKGEQTQREATITSMAGTKVPILLNSYPAKDKDGNVVSVVFTLRDTSRQQEVDRLKSDFIRAISHEMRVPLSAIVGMSEMLLDGDLAEPKKKTFYLKTIHEEGLKLSSVISELLDLTAIESGKEVMHMGEMNMEGFLSEMKEEFDPLAARKDSTINLSLKGDFSGFGGDAEKLKRLLRNLIDNSLSYSDPGVAIELSAVAKQGAVEIAVKDTGWGIPEEDLPHVGEKFYRGKNALPAKGKGLGLSFSAGIARMHDGHIRVESTEGVGTTVTVTLPLGKAANEKTP